MKIRDFRINVGFLFPFWLFKSSASEAWEKLMYLQVSACCLHLSRYVFTHTHVLVGTENTVWCTSRTCLYPAYWRQCWSDFFPVSTVLMLAAADASCLPVNSLGALRQRCSSSIVLFSFISWGTFTQRSFLSPIVWLPIGASLYRKEGEWAILFIYPDLQMVHWVSHS